MEINLLFLQQHILYLKMNLIVEIPFFLADEKIFFSKYMPHTSPRKTIPHLPHQKLYSWKTGLFQSDLLMDILIYFKCVYTTAIVLLFIIY